MSHSCIANKKYLSIEGGGFVVHSIVPILKRLEDLGFHPEGFSGTSAGSIDAMMLALGYNADEIASIASEINWKEYTQYTPPATFRLATQLGWFDNAPQREVIRQIIRGKGWNPDLLTLRQLPYKLWVATTKFVRRSNFKEAETFVFGPDSDALVADVVLASCAIPLVFPLVKVGEYYYADGGLILNHPITVHNNPEEVLGFRFDRGTEIKYNHFSGDIPFKPSLRDLFSSLFALLHKNANHLDEKWWEQIVQIDVTEFDTLNFDSRIIPQLHQRGIEAFDRWLEKRGIKTATALTDIKVGQIVTSDQISFTKEKPNGK